MKLRSKDLLVTNNEFKTSSLNGTFKYVKTFYLNHSAILIPIS